MLLTLDLATSTGWTHGRPEDRFFEYGTYIIPKSETLGEYLQHFRYWIHGMLDGVELCVFEAPVLPKSTSIQTCRKLYCLAGIVEMACRDYCIKVMEVNNQTVKAFMGSGSYNKQQMIDATRRFGYDPETSDAADAIGLRLLVLHRHFPKVPNMELGLGLLGARP